MFFVSFIVLILTFVPAMVLTLLWLKFRERRMPFPAAGWGATLLLGSFFYLPWLDLQPLKHFGLEWLYDVGPPAFEILFRMLNLERWLQLTETVSGLELVFNPRGWLALLLSGGFLMWAVVLALGTIVTTLAYAVCVRPYRRWLGGGLAMSSLALLLILFYQLPAIDGLGERSFPSVFALAVPILGAHLIWIGPTVMLLALLLLAVIGLVHAQGAERRDRPSMYDELDPFSGAPYAG